MYPHRLFLLGCGIVGQYSGTCTNILFFSCEEMVILRHEISDSGVQLQKLTSFILKMLPLFYFWPSVFSSATIQTCAGGDVSAPEEHHGKRHLRGEEAQVLSGSEASLGDSSLSSERRG